MAYERVPGLFAGVGIILHDGLVGIDLDNCRDPQTEIVETWAQTGADKVAYLHRDFAHRHPGGLTMSGPGSPLLQVEWEDLLPAIRPRPICGHCPGH